MEPVDFFILLVVFIILFCYGLIKFPLITALFILSIWGIYKLKKNKKK
jgi:hypothetical protein